MKWIEIRVYTTTEATDAVCAALENAGITGVQIEDAAYFKDFLNRGGKWDYVDEELLNAPDGEACVKFYVSDNDYGRESLRRARSEVAELPSMDTGLDLGRLMLETKIVDDADWLDIWKEYYKPFPVGEKLVIRPGWEEYDDNDKVVVTLDPGHVFGTGLHQSTQLSLERLEKIVRGGERVLDLGCGSGILSIAAMLLGASSALAVDIDPNAVEIARANAELNGVERDYRALSGDAAADPDIEFEILREKYDVIAANIVADVIISLTGLAAQCMHPGGYFITSGIISRQAGEVREALAEMFEIVDETNRDEWVCIVGRKKQ